MLQAFASGGPEVHSEMKNFNKLPKDVLKYIARHLSPFNMIDFAEVLYEGGLVEEADWVNGMVDDEIERWYNPSKKIKLY